MKKSELEALAKRTKETVRKGLKVKTEKGVRTSAGDADPGANIEVLPDTVSLTKYMRGGIQNIWKDAEPEQRLYKALGQDSGRSGGFFVPPVLSNTLIPLLQEKAVMRAMGATVIPVSGTDKIIWNRIMSDPVITWGTEAGTIIEDTGLQFGQTTLETHKMICLYKLSRELLDNASINMDAIVRERMASALALEEDNVFLQGMGGTQPLGFYYQTRVSSTDLSGSISLDTIKNSVYQVRNLNSEVTGWVAHPRTVNFLSKLKDADGRYMIGQGPGEVGTNVFNMNGIPLRQTTKVSALLRPGATETFMVGGKWSDMTIGDGQGLRIETSGDVYFTTDQIGMRLVKFIGMQLTQTASFVVIKGITE